MELELAKIRQAPANTPPEPNDLGAGRLAPRPGSSSPYPVMHANRVLHVALLVTALALAAGCNTRVSTVTLTDTIPLKVGSEPEILIETFNGSIDLSTGETTDEAVIEIHYRASGSNPSSARQSLNRIEPEIDVTPDGLRFAIRSPAKGTCGASLVVAVPARSRVKLKTSNGYIMAEGVRDGLEAKTSNAAITVVDGAGLMQLSTINARIDVAASDATLVARTSNARVKFSGSLGPGKSELRTSNAPIEVALPRDSRVKFDVAAMNSRIRDDLSVDKQKSSRSRLVGTIGDDPTSELKIQTSNSSVRIRDIDQAE